MHEMSLLNDLMNKIQKIATENRASSVISVRVKLGALSHISKEHFREHFQQAVRGTVAEGARLEVDLMTDINDPQAQDIILESVEIT